VVGTDPRVVLQEDVAVADTDVRGAVLQCPLHDEIRAPCEEDRVRPEHRAVASPGEHRRVEVVTLDDDVGTRDVAQGLAVVDVEVPELRAQHLVGDRVDDLGPLVVEAEAGVDRELGGR
jgi:hypothetical protein